METAGRDVYLVGHSYGALCSLEAALITDAIGRMLLHEPPAPTPGRPVATAQVLERIRAAAAAGDHQRELVTFSGEVIRLTSARSTP